MAKSRKKIARKSKVQKDLLHKDSIKYHLGQMGFIAVIILIVWLITAIADARGM